MLVSSPRRGPSTLTVLVEPEHGNAQMGQRGPYRVNGRAVVMAIRESEERLSLVECRPKPHAMFRRHR
jgi:hypothetical protein